MADDNVLIEVRDGIGTATLNKPDRLNAWDTPMRERLAGVLGDFNDDPAVRAVIVTGAGELAFSAGQDLGETKEFSSGEEGKAWFLTWRTFYDAFRRLDKPVIAALNGVAAGSAFQVAMLADVRVGHPGVRMGQPEINSGIPSVLGPLLMNARIGLSRTIELTLTGRMMEAEECHHIGLIHYLVPESEVMAKARELGDLLAAKPPIAMRLNRRRFREMTQADFDDAFAAGQSIQEEAYGSGEPQAAMEAFFAERAARKSGG